MNVLYAKLIILVNWKTGLVKFRLSANKEKQAGSDVTLQVWSNMMHVWHTFEPELDEAKEAFNEIKKFILQLE